MLVSLVYKNVLGFTSMVSLMFGIMKGTYVETTDNTLKELSRFQDFVYRYFHNYKCYKDMKPESNQPARLYGTAKTLKFETLEDITVASLTFRPIIDCFSFIVF